MAKIKLSPVAKEEKYRNEQVKAVRKILETQIPQGVGWRTTVIGDIIRDMESKFYLVRKEDTGATK